ncbi:chaperone protein dnaJ 72 [Magnolia sinica]|uniref:chaperone protein dnaJ 72 n=1 Tax=Magnolia sinica TaxID=86752 RepID=UPI002657B536|nr:chaperone protein dnaJ 72 [Magnolia sinica]
MDHYKILGLSRNATKDEIKEAFRNLALKFHPDKHSQSSKEVRDGATVRFKQVSEAYEVLIDDRKRADYNLRSGSFNGRGGFSGGGNSRSGGYGYSRNAYRPKERAGFNFDILLRFVTRRGFLLNLAFGGVILGGAVAIERSGEAIWKMQNSGKSFEEAMESIEKIKAQKKKN